MARRRTLKHRKSLRRTRRHHKRQRREGGGWSDLPKGPFSEIAVNPGNQIHFPYTGPGKDCTGNPHSYRPGTIFDYTPKGLPGWSGGKRRGRKSRGGAAMPPPATVGAAVLPGPVPNPNLPPVSASLTAKPNEFPNPTGTGGTVGNPNPQGLPVVMSMPGVPPPGMAQMPTMPIADLPKQSGGRYGFFPQMGPLNPINGVGTSPAPFGRIPCEVGTFNPLNPNPFGIQTSNTAPLTPPFVSGLAQQAGGGLPAGTGLAASSANFPTVQVGQSDSMRYYAPTAGYRNDFMTFRAPSPVPGLTIQTPYDAKAFNQACIKTNGGSRKNKNHNGGAMPVAMDAGTFSTLKMNEITTRMDFDGTKGLLPMKFGGRRRKSKRVLKNKYKSRKYHN